MPRNAHTFIQTTCKFPSLSILVDRSVLCSLNSHIRITDESHFCLISIINIIVTWNNSLTIFVVFWLNINILMLCFKKFVDFILGLSLRVQTDIRQIFEPWSHQGITRIWITLISLFFCLSKLADALGLRLTDFVFQYLFNFNAPFCLSSLFLQNCLFSLYG